MTTQDVTGQPATTNPVTEGETAPETAVRSAVSQDAVAEEPKRAGAQARARVTQFLQSHRRFQTAWDVAVGDRPSVWSESPASPAEVFRYACAGQWCAPESRYLRWAGQAYCLGVAVPLTVVAYVAAWVLQRPARGAAVLVLYVIVRLFG